MNRGPDCSYKNANTGKIIEKLFRSTLLVLIISTITTMMGTLIDGMIISKFLGSAAIAGMGIGGAYTNMITVLSAGIAAGTQNLIGGEIGKGKLKEANALLGLSAVMIITLSLAVMILTNAFPRPVSLIFGVSESMPEVQQAAMDYIQGFSFGLPAVFGVAVLTPVMQLDSDRKRAVHSVIVLSVANIAGDLLNIFVFKGGMLWMGITTSIAYWTGFAVLLLHFRRKEAALRIRFSPVCFRDSLRIFADGFPVAFMKLGTMLRTLVFNNISTLAGGAIGLAANTIIANLTAVLSCFPKGYGSSVLTIGGMLHGEEDRSGLKNLLRASFRTGSIISGAVMLLLLAAAPYIAMLYTSPSAEEYAMVVAGIRWYGLSMIPYSFSTILINYYHSTHRIHLANILNFSDTFLFMAVCALALFRQIGINAIWFAYFGGKILVLIFIFIIVSIHNRHPALRMDDYLLLRDDYDVPDEQKIDITVTTMEEVISLSERAEAFCLRNGIEERKSVMTGLFIEEMVGSVVTHGFNGKDDQYVDVRVICKGDEVTIRLRDNCDRFDVKEYYRTVSGSDVSSSLGISTVMRIARDVRYVNAMKLNCLIIRV